MARINIPESSSIRRLAAALATCQPPDTISGSKLGFSVGRFFREFPWDGRRRRSKGALPAIDLATVGHYFSRFDWDARPKRSDERITEVEALPGRVAPTVLELFPSR